MYLYGNTHPAVDYILWRRCLCTTSEDKYFCLAKPGVELLKAYSLNDHHLITNPYKINLHTCAPQEWYSLTYQKTTKSSFTFVHSYQGATRYETCRSTALWTIFMLGQWTYTESASINIHHHIYTDQSSLSICTEVHHPFALAATSSKRSYMSGCISCVQHDLAAWRGLGKLMFRIGNICMSPTLLCTYILT